MADVSKIVLINGDEYDLKDSTARSGLSDKADKATTLSGYGITNAYTKTEVDSLVSSVFTYKGTKSTYAQVSALTDMKTGDVWQVTEDNSEYVYNGTAWEKLGPTIDLSGYLTSVSVAGQSLTPGSNSITAAQLKTALGLGSAAYASTASSVGNNTNLPTGAAVKSFVEGKGYTTNTGTVTSVATGTGLTGGPITTTGTISLEGGVVTAGSAGPTAAVTGNEGTIVAIPRITVDTYGRVTGLTSYNLTNKNTTYTAATTAPGNVASSSAVGTSTNYARQDHTHGIALATGDSNGQVKIAGTNIDVKGLGDVAYTDDGSTSVTSHDVSGSVLSFTATNAQPVKSLVLSIEPTQSGSGDPSPSNIRPISGYDAVNVVRDSGRVVTVTMEQGTINTANGSSSSSTTRIRSAGYAPIEAGTYKIYVPDGFQYSYRTYTTNDTTGYLSSECPSAWLTGTTTFTTTGSYIRFVISNSTNTTIVPDDFDATKLCMAKELAVYPISLSSAGTVYGGSLDVVSGVLTVDRVMKEFDGSSDETWTTLTTANVFRHNALDPLVDDSRKVSGTISNECYVSSYSYSNMKGNYPSISFDTTGRLYIAISDDHSTVAQCQAWLAENPLQVCYYLDTPLTYHLTPTEVTTLLGSNTIWMDAEGTMELTYEDVVSPIKYAEVGELGSAATHNASDTVIPDSTLPTGLAVSNLIGSRSHTYLGTCTTAAATAAKVITLTDADDFELRVGTVIGVKFSASNTASSVTFNVNNTGAIGISYVKDTRYTGSTNTICGHISYIMYYMYDGTYWCFLNNSSNYTNNSNTVPAAQCETAAATAAKAATITNYTLTANTYLHFNIRYANTVAGAITMNVNSKGAKPIYINGAASSSSNHTLPAGTYIAFYNGTYWDFRTDGKLPASITGTVNGYSVNKDVPSTAVFTDTTSLTSMTGILPLANGGTNASNAADARTNLGLGTVATYDVEVEVANDAGIPTGSAITNLKNSLVVDGVSFNGVTSVVHYGESTTAAGTAAKTATVTNFAMTDGAVVYIRFAYANTATAPTLNINGTGAANIRYRNANISSTYLVANEVYCFVYYGGYYQLVGDVTTSATTAQIQSAVDTWLDEHTSSSTIVYSSSLTHSVVTTTTDILW